jgi:hypothetical protein
MPTLGLTDIANHAFAAGFSTAAYDGVGIATAIALAESGGNTDAHHVAGPPKQRIPEDSRGLWQINVLAHPEFASQNLYDPAVNAKAALAVYKKQGWNAWSTFNGVKYFAYLPLTSAVASTLNVKTLPGDTGKAIVSNVPGVEEAKTIAEVSGKVGSFLVNPHNWLRILYVAVGGVILVIALNIFAKPVTEPIILEGGKVAGAVAKGAAA